MKIISFVLLFIAVLTGVFFVLYNRSDLVTTGAPPYDADSGNSLEGLYDISDIVNWKRPEGPTRVGIQVGHWKSNELPEELERLRGNTGASGYGMSEWEVNFAIAKRIAEILEEEKIVVDILPATIPPDYWADVFIAIHADGNENRTKSGFKIAGPRRDYTGKNNQIIELLKKVYEDSTELSWDEEGISRNMKGYYAFSWRRFEHSIHPMTPAIIFETGFLTNQTDAQLIAGDPDIPAGAIAKGLIMFLKPSS